MKTKAPTSRRRMVSRGSGERPCRNSGSKQQMRLLLSSLFVLAGIPSAPGRRVNSSEGRDGGDRDVMVVGGERPLSDGSSTSSSSSPSAPESSESESESESPPKLLSFDLIPAREVLERRGSMTDEPEGGARGSEGHRRLRAVRVGSSSLQTDALFQGYGTHYVDLWVGTPVPQRQTVIVDTGSPSTAFPCTGCRGNCGERYHTDAYFDPSKSVTFRRLPCSECGQGVCKRGDGDDAPPPLPLPPASSSSRAINGGDRDAFCDMQLRYGEGSSWSAYEAEDVLYTGGSHGEGVTGDRLARMVTPVTFGCQRSVTGLFKTQLADGIMGMSKNVNSFWDQLYKAGKIDSRKFSLCYSRHRTTERSGTRAGFMTLGGTDPTRHTSPMVYARDVGETGAYSVHMRKIYLRRGGGESIRPSTASSSAERQKLVRVDIDEATLNSNGFMVDSGSSDTYFPVALLEPFKAAWEEVTGKKYTTSPIRLTDEQLSKLPTIIIQLRGSEKFPTRQVGWNSTAPIDPMYPRDVAIAVPATRYLTYSGGRYYNGIRMEKDSTDGILGANTMQGHDVLFDFENSRIGFAEADCDVPVGRSTSEAYVESIPPEDKFPVPAHHPDHFAFNLLHPERYLATALGWDCDSTTDCAGFVVIFLLSFVVNLLLVSIVLRRLGPRWRRMRVRLFDRVDKDGGDEVSPLGGGSSSSLIVDKPPSRISI